ncbi:MAG: hypothetical protein AAGA93_17320 [Actinomycetota bacterium]
MTTPEADPILAKRAQVARLTTFGIRFGMGCYLLATVLFFVAVATSFTGFLTTTLTVLLLVGSAALAPAMVFHYAVKAADRADRDGEW